MMRLLIDVGRRAGVRPSDIVGAIANEAGLSGRNIGVIDIYDEFTFVEVPAHYQEQVLAAMSDVTIRNRAIKIRPATVQDMTPQRPTKKPTRRTIHRKPPAQLTKNRGGRSGKREKNRD
jgi:hypothetical protein